MRKLKRILPLFIIAFVLLGSISAYAVDISARGGFVMNSQTGEALYNYNADTPLVPASMTKVMSLYVIYSHIASGAVNANTQIPVNGALAAYSRDPGYSNVILNSGTTYSLSEMISAICTVSANAAVMAVGDYLCGSEANFVAEMNYWVRQWGLNAYFTDCTGVSSQNRVTPRAMAVIANRLICDYPDVLNYTSQTGINFRGTAYGSTNKMLPGRAYDYYGTDGLKTGTTSAAGCCFTGTVERGGTRLVSVVMGAPSTNMRYVDTIKMLDYSFSLTSAADTVAQEQQNKDYIVATALRIYINDCEIPAFLHQGENECGVVLVDELEDYGFDVSYDINTDTVTIVNNTDKEITAADLKNKEGEALEISGMEPAKILLKNGADDVGQYVDTVFDVGGRAAISIDEFWKMGNVVWNSKHNLVVVVTR